MALNITNNYTYKGIDIPDNYTKITKVDIRENTEYDENGNIVTPEVKTYIANVIYSTYTNSNKTDVLESAGYDIVGLTESELTIPTYYTKLKELEQFKNCTDI